MKLHGSFDDKSLAMTEFVEAGAKVSAFSINANPAFRSNLVALNLKGFQNRCGLSKRISTAIGAKRNTICRLLS